MAKSQLFSNRLFNWIFFHGGVFPVRRGHGDQEAFITAHTILAQGRLRADVRRGRPLAVPQPR